MLFTFGKGDRPLDGYTIEQTLGHGGFGEVYRAISDGGKQVALKLVQRFLDVELRGVGHCLNLKHTNLITVYDVRTDDAERSWIVMEYVDGRDLADVIDDAPEGLPIEDVLHWLEGIGGAVEHLHQAGIVHRDLKPGNIFDDGGVVKVGDYGLSKFITASRRSAQTQSVGTVYYMAPEVGSGRYGREVDVYAVGVMLYEMLTGNVPFAGETPAEILIKHLTAPPDLSIVPTKFRNVLARMLAKNPEERYSSLQVAIADLKAQISDTAPPETGTDEENEASYEAPSSYHKPGLTTWVESPIAAMHEWNQARKSEEQYPQPPPQPLPLSAESSRLRHRVEPGARIGALGAAGRLLMASISGVGVGLLLAGTMMLMAPRREEAAVCVGVAAGLFTAAMFMRAFASMNSRLQWLRLVNSLFLSVGAGLLLAGFVMMANPRAEEEAMFFGFGTGFLVAAVTAYRSLDSIPQMRRLQAFLSVFFGVGTGLLTAGFGISGRMGRDEEVGLFATGVGFLIAAAFITRCLALGTALRLSRLIAPLFWGTGAGFASGFLGLLMTRQDEVAVLMGVGAGFLTCGITAWLLFFSPVADKSRSHL